jgi:hypothetical protein
MITTTITRVNSGEAFVIGGDAADGHMLSFSGFGPAPQHIITERGPAQDGETYVGHRLDRRVLNMKLYVPNASLLLARDSRRALGRVVAPGSRLIMVRDWGDGETYAIDCYHNTLLRGDSDTFQGFGQDIPLSLFAPDPTWYVPTLQSITFALSASAQSGISVPTEIPTSVGSDEVDAEKNIVYAGDAASYPMIRIMGPAANPVLTNETLGLKLDFTGTTIAALDYYDIDTRYGVKTANDSAGDSVIANLTSDSNLVDFRIGDSINDAAPDGSQTFTFTCTGASAATGVTIQYYVRYLGV